MTLPPLHAILDVDTAARLGRAPLDLAAAFLDGGARLIQLRAKQLAAGPFLELCDAVVSRAGAYGAAIIVNDRVDLARMSGAAGVHVGQDDLPPVQARAILGAEAIVGYSTHTLEQVGAALREPVSYVAVGPVFSTTSKDTGYSNVGLDLVRQAAHAAAGRPIVAIGGITLATAWSVIEAGATSVAVIGDLVAGDPAERVAAYISRLAGASRL